MIEAKDDFWAELKAGYRTPPRAYHTFDHVREVLRHFDQVKTSIGWQRPTEVYLAVLFHDIVYVCGASNNEARSALAARNAIDRWLPHLDIDGDYVAALIERTADHGKLTRDSVSEETALFLDCDMAILGSDWESYSAYEEGVRWEYTQVITPDAYAMGRAAFLKRLLDVERIYLSDFFHDRLNDAARENIARSLSEH